MGNDFVVGTTAFTLAGLVLAGFVWWVVGLDEWDRIELWFLLMMGA